ncbi:MAG: hypothetical protein JW967_10930 [Dehalococcoidales bacterium]|nr:hypothetical protein [Dehalococcoidales bacterium]
MVNMVANKTGQEMNVEEVKKLRVLTDRLKKMEARMGRCRSHCMSGKLGCINEIMERDRYTITKKRG